tara:strand:+ start:2233 stop:3192 length:960 start_codon:yes stop_codon:yes gene_type:complete
MGNSCYKNKKIQPIKIVDTCILKWESIKKTEKYHWWPLCELNENDTTNNLYAKGNALSKYDSLFGTNAVFYQTQKHYIPKDSSRSDKSWAGFCNYASIMSSLYSYPRYPVTIKHKTKILTLSINEIEQLLIIACSNSIKPNISFFFGKRNYNDTKHDYDINTSNKSNDEPLPLDLLNMLELMCKNNNPFIMDIDNGTDVWNYAYDSVKVYKYKTCPLHHNAPSIGTTDYYNFKINSNGYPEENQNLWGYVNTIYKDDEGIMCRTEKWISNNHPDFIWAKYPINKPWEGKCIINPEVDARIVYEIYKLSLNSYSNTLVIN